MACDEKREQKVPFCCKKQTQWLIQNQPWQWWWWQTPQSYWEGQGELSLSAVSVKMCFPGWCVLDKHTKGISMEG